MNLSLRQVTGSLAALLAPVCAQDRIESTETYYPGAFDRPDQTWILSRVVDDLSGAPIANAEVFLVREADTPIAGEFWFTRRVRTDADGWLRAPVADIQNEWHMQVLRHPDYGVAARHGAGDYVWRVGRPFDVPVRILDWQGKPAAGAKIGFCMGCGHTPDLVSAITREDGVAVLRGIDPHGDIGDVYVQRAGLGLGYDSVRWNPGESPEIVACRWSPAMTGTVIDHNGKPVQGVFVAALDVHRGPWARTRLDGTFTLLGGRPEIGPSHVRMPSGREVWFAQPRRYPVTLRLPDPLGASPHHGAIVQPPGKVERLPTRRVRVAFRGRDDLKASSIWPGTTRPLPCDEQQRIEVPTSGPFVIRVGIEDGPRGRPWRRAFAFEDASELPPEPVPLSFFEPTEVVGRIVGPEGEPVAARVFLRESFCESEVPEDAAAMAPAPAASFSRNTLLTGLTLVEVVPARQDLQTRLAWALLPERGRGRRRVDLGALALAKEPQLRIVDEQGRPIAEASAWFARAGLQEAGQLRPFPLAADGGWLGPDLKEGDAIVVNATAGAVPHRTVLSGQAPWLIRVPAGSLQLDVTCEGRAAGDVAVTCLLGDYDCRWRPDSPFVGLPAGRLRCYVSAPGYRSAVADVEIGRGRKRLTVDLQKR